MSFRTLTAHALFALAAVLAAWWLAHRVEEKKGGPTSVVLLDAKKGEVKSIAYQWPKGSSTVTPSGSGDARRATVEVSRTVDPKKTPPKKDDKKAAGADGGVADAGAAGTPEPEPQPTREEARFPGAKAVLTSVESLEPLKTRRSLGEVDAGRLKEMGLESPERTLTITTASGQKLVLEIGESSYGGQGRYARKQGDRVVHLIESSLVTGLEGGVDTLMEKRILLPEAEKVLGFEVRHGDKGAAFVHVERSQSAKRYFAAKDDPGTKSEEAGAVMKTLRDMRATKLATKNQAGSAVATVVIDVEGSGGNALELVERVDASGYLVKSGDWLFEISETHGKELLEDLGALLP